MANSRILGQLQCGIAAGVLGFALTLCVSAAPSLAQQQQDSTRLTERLFDAVKKNDMAAVRSVLSAGADPMARDATGQTPAGLAIDQGYFPIAHFILSVRNQNNLQRQRDADAPGRQPPAAGTVGPVATPAPAQSVREPLTPSWRATTPQGQPANVPPARVTPPREAVVITPAEPKRAGAATNAGAASQAAKAQPASPVTPAPAAPQLTHLPRLPNGAPNPFDPTNTVAPALPVITAIGAPPASTPAASSPRASGGNPLNRLWSGVTDLFSRDEAPEPSPVIPAAPPATPVTSDKPAEPRAAAPDGEPPALARFFSTVVRPAQPIEAPVAEAAPAPIATIIFAESRPAAATAEPPTDIEQGPIGRFMTDLLRRAEPETTDAVATIEPAVVAAAPIVDEPPAAAAPGPLSHVFATLVRRDPPPFETPEMAGAEVSPLVVAGPAAPVVAAPPAEVTPGPIGRFVASLFRRDPPPVETPQIVARTEPAPLPVAAPVAPVAAPPAEVTPNPIARFFANLVRRDPPPVEAPDVARAEPAPPLPAAAPVAPVAAPPAEVTPNPIARFFANLVRRDPPPVEAPDVARAEPASVATAPVAPVAEPPAEVTPNPIARFFANLVRRDPPPVETPQIVARAEPVPAERTTIDVEAPPLSDEPSASRRPSGFFANLIRHEPARAGNPLSAFETAAALPDQQGPLPIIADPTLIAPKAAAPKPEPKADYAVAPTVFPEARDATRSDGFGNFLRGLFRAKVEEPDAAKIASAAKEDAAARFQVAALSGPARDAERAPAPSVAPPRVTTGPLGIEGFSFTRALADARTRAQRCFQKGREPGWYCLENVEWPAEIAEGMEVDSWLYSRGRIIVHYDAGGAAQSLFALFPSDHFNRIVRFLEAKLGPASSDANRRVALIGEPAKLNQITSWMRRETAEAKPAVLEIRKFDTVRSMIPDTRHGFVSLSRDGASPIFRYVSEADLMMQSMRMESGGAVGPAPKR